MEFDNDIKLKGYIKNILKRDGTIILITFQDCLVKQKSKILFKPEWGNYDIICGTKITSVYNGPADSNNYYIDFNEKKSNYSLKYNTSSTKKIDSLLNNLFKEIALLKGEGNINDYFNIYKDMKKKSVVDWLLKYKLLEVTNCNKNISWILEIYKDLEKISQKNSDLSRAIKRGLKLFN